MNYAPYWDIFHRYQTAKAIAETLDLLPENWNFTPIGDRKAPYRDNWQNEELAREHIKKCLLHGEEVISKKTGKPYHRYSSGYGLLTGEQSGGLLAIDFDGASAALVWEAIAQGNETPLTVSWTSGKPGRKQLLFQVPEHIREKLREYDFHRAVVTEFNEVKTARHTETVKGKEVEKIDDLLEFRYSNHQSVLPPSYHPDTGSYKWINSPFDVPVALLPEWLYETLINLAKREKQLTEEKLANKQNKERKNPHKTNSYSPSFSNDNNWTDEDWARSYLAAIHPSRFDSYDDWLRIGMACHSVNDNLLYDWDKASQQSSKYKPGECDRKWQSFSNCSSVTIGTLYHYAVADGWVNPLKRLGWIYRDGNSTKNTQKTISKEQWVNIKAVHSFREILNKVLDKPKECLAIVPLKDGIAASGIIQYYPGFLPDWDEYVALGCPKIIYNPKDQLDFYNETELRNYPDTVDQTITGGGKSYAVGLLKRQKTDLILSDQLAWIIALSNISINPKYLLQLILIESIKIEGRNWYFCQSPKNITTPTVRKNYERLIDRTAGDVMDYSKCDDEGNPYIRKAKKSETPDIPANCPFTNVFTLATEELDSFIPGGPDSPVCGRCPFLKNCPFLTTRREQLKANNNIAAHPSQIGSAAVSRDRAIIDEPGKTVETQKLVTVRQRQILESEFLVSQSDHPHKKAIAKLLRMYAATLYEAHQDNFPKYGLNAEKTLEAILKMLVNQDVKMPDFYELKQKISVGKWFKSEEFDFPVNNLDQLASNLAIKIWQRFQDLGECFPHPTISIVEQLINEQIASDYDDNYDVWKIPTIKELVKEFNEIAGNKWDKILAGKQTPEEQEQAIREHGKLNTIRNLLPALYDPFTSLSMNGHGYEVVRKNWRNIKNIKKFKTRLYLDATTPAYVLKRKFLIKHLAVAQQAILPNSCSNLKVEIIDNAGTFGRVPEGGSLPESTFQRWNELAKHLAQLESSCGKVALFGYKGQEGLYSEVLPLIAGTGAMFSDTTGNNRYQDFDCIIAAAEPRENVRQKESEFQSIFGVFPTGKHRAWFQSWYRQRVTEEIIQTIGRLRPSRTDAPKTVYLLAGDCLTAANVAQIAAAFSGCTINRTNVIDICPEAAMKGDRRNRDLLTQAVTLAQEGNLKLEELAGRLELTKGRVSQLVKQATGYGFKQFVKSLILLLDALNNKTKLFSELDPPAQMLAKALEETGLQVGLGQMDAEELAETLNDLTRIVGRKDLIEVLRAVPGLVLREFIRVIFSKMAQMMWEKVANSPPESILIAA